MERNDRTEVEQTDLLSAALEYAQRGVPVFPLEPGSKQPLGRLAPNGANSATTDLSTIKSCWTQAPDANIGVATTNLFVLDVDPRKGGDKTFEGLITLIGELPEGPIARTGGGGLHFFFRLPTVPFRRGTDALGPGLDIKAGPGLYVMAAPSIHPNGTRYTWIRGLDIELPEVPALLLERLTRKKTEKFTVPPTVTEGSRNDTLFRLGRSLKATGNDAVSIGAALMTRNQTFSPSLEDTEVERIIASVIGQPDRPDFTPPSSASPSGRSASSPPAEKLTITINGDLTDMTEQGWGAIVQANTGPSLFQRSTIGVRLERDDDDYLTTKALTEHRLRRELARSATFYAVGDDGKLKEVYPPITIVQNMLAVAKLPLPVLDRIVEVPTFTASGKLRTEPGYDPDGRTFYQPPPGLNIAPVPDKPTAQQIRDAVALILDVFGEFDVVGKADTAHAVALMLQPFVRELIKGPVPCHVFDAPTPGTGKSLMARAALLPFLGRAVSAMPPARDEEEWRKRIGAKVMQTTPVVFIDNLKTGVSLDSSSLAMAITS